MRHAGTKNDLSALAFMKPYVQDRDRAAASSKSADELVAQTKNGIPISAWRIC